MDRTEKIKRILIYLIGMLILAFGLTLSSETDLGTSALTSLPFVMSELSGISLGNTMFALYFIFVVCELVITHDKHTAPVYLMQIPVSIVFTRVMDIIDLMIDLTGTSIYFRLFCMLLSVTCIGVGSCLGLRMRIIANPGDGFVQTIAEWVGKPLGNVKNIVDISFVIAAATVSLLCLHRLAGAGIGTIMSMIGVGRVIAATNWICDRTGVKKY